MLDKENLKLLEDWKDYIIDKPDRLCIRDKRGNSINVPSSKYPSYTNKMEVFSTYNTHKLEDKKIEEIFNKVQFEMGRCYSNVENFLKALKKNNINNVIPYSGWLVVKSNLPKHHSFLVLKENDKNYVLDFSSNFTKKEIDELQEKKGFSLSPDEVRRNMLEAYKAKEKLPNSQKCCFGKVDEIYLYIAEPRDPNEAREDFLRLMDLYPDHISYKTTDKTTGLSPVQRMYYKGRSKGC